MFSRIALTVVLLIISNTFMTVAWYGHLRHKATPLVAAILTSWGIAFAEYLFQVPANRIGSASLTVTQLKIIQEAITLCVFTVYALLVFKEGIRWNNVLAMVLVLGAVALTFIPKPAAP